MPCLGPKSLVTQSDSAMRSAHVAETPPLPLLKSKIVSISIMQGAHYNSHTHARTYTHRHTHECLLVLAFRASIPSKRFDRKRQQAGEAGGAGRQDGTRTWRRRRRGQTLSNISLIKHANVAHFNFAQVSCMLYAPLHIHIL